MRDPFKERIEKSFCLLFSRFGFAFERAEDPLALRIRSGELCFWFEEGPKGRLAVSCRSDDCNWFDLTLLKVLIDNENLRFQFSDDSAIAAFIEKNLDLIRQLLSGNEVSKTLANIDRLKEERADILFPK